MRVLITGATGFVGNHLAEHLFQKKGVELFGVGRPRSKKKAHPSVRMFSCDLRNAVRTAEVLKKIKPERIFHLAAFASVAQSWQDPAGAFDNNVTATRLLFDGIRRNCPKARVHVAGSAEVYGGCSKKGERLKENAPFRPMNPYAVSKIAQEALAHQSFLSYGMHVVRTRAFNHIGPRQSDVFVTADFAKQTALTEAGRHKPVIRVGNLAAVRDFTDVRDVVRAYWLCLERGTPGDVYNVCSGRGRHISELLQFYLSRATVRITVVKDKARFRTVDAPALVGDPGRLKARTGWHPVHTFENTLTDILEYWRKQCAS